MASHTLFATNALLCTDLWRASASSADFTSHSAFCEWVVDLYFQNQNQCPDSVSSLLNLVTHNQDCALYNRAQLLQKLKKKSFGRTYRIVAAVLPRENENQRDTRVRTLLEHLLAEKTLLSITPLVCSFFTDCGRSVSAGRLAGYFKTSLSTRFQQLLFLTACIKISKLRSKRGRSRSSRGDIGSKRGKKRRSPDDSGKSDDGSTATRNRFKFLPTNGQRIGACVQKIVRGWDSYAQYLGFDDAEHLCEPYLTLEPASSQYYILRSKEDGFAPMQSRFSIVFNDEVTHDPSLTFPGVLSRPTTVDTALRSICNQFLADIDEAVRSMDLYNSTGNTPLPFLSRFESLTSELPPRFRQFLPQESAEVRTYTQNNNPSSAHSTRQILHLSAEPALETSAADASAYPDAASAPSTTLGNYQWSKKALFRAMKSHAALYRCSFEDLVDTHVVAGGDHPIEESVQLVLTDPPYNCRRERGDRNASHDCLTTQDMEKVVDVIATILRKGGHAILFCSIQQFSVWSTFFQSHQTAKERGSSPTFTVSPCPDYFVYHPSHHNGFPGRKSCTRANSVELGVHVKKNGLSFSEEKAMVNYKNHNFVDSSFSAYKNVMDNLRGPVGRERLYTRSSSTSSSHMLRPEQKSIALLKELVARHTQPDDIVVDLFGGTFSTAIACLTMPEPRNFIGCELDDDCFPLAKDHVISYFAAAIAERRFAIQVAGEVLQAAEIYTSAAAHETRMPVSFSHEPSPFPVYQYFPTRLCSFLSSTFGDPSFFLKTMRVPYDKWSIQHQSFFNLLDSETLLHAEASQHDLLVGPSTIKHPFASRGVFASRTFHENEIICSFYGTLVYSDLTKKDNKYKIIGEGLLKVDATLFATRSIQIKTEGKAFEGIKDLLNGRKAVSIVPPSFAVAGFVNEASYFEGDEEYESYKKGKIQFPRAANVKFAQLCSVSSLKQILSPDVVVVQATSLINPGEELFSLYHMEKLSSIADD